MVGYKCGEADALDTLLLGISRYGFAWVGWKEVALPHLRLGFNGQSGDEFEWCDKVLSVNPG